MLIHRLKIKNKNGSARILSVVDSNGITTALMFLLVTIIIMSHTSLKPGNVQIVSTTLINE
jgi:hypothetical protein